MGNANSSIYNGRWYDHAAGVEVRTVSGSGVQALQAALPVIITFIGSQWWLVVRILLYHWYWRRRDHNRPLVFAEQRSVIIRNSSGGLSLLFGVCGQWRAWRKQVKLGMRPRASGPTIPKFRYSPPPMLCLIAFGHFAFWTIAGAYLIGLAWGQTSKTVPTNALLRGPCGNLDIYNAANATQQLLYRTVNNNQSVSADQYVKQCYVDDTSVTAPCGQYAQRRLQVQDSDAPCPFLGASTCIQNANTTPYTMDTGYLSSSTDLGINAILGDQILFRKLTTCSPVSSKGRTDIVNYTRANDQQEWPANTKLYRFYFGPLAPAQGNATFTSDWTYEFSEWKPEHNLYYDISAVPYFGGAYLNIWKPNATFWDATRFDADVAMFFLNGDHVTYSYPVYDPVFSTHTTYKPKYLITPEFYTNVLACIDQYQICPADKDRKFCTQNSGSFELGNRIFDIGLNKNQLATAQRITLLYPSLSTYNAAEGRGAAALLASLTVADSRQTQALPVDQWRREVKHWFQISLAKLQQRVIDFASVPADPALRSTAIPPSNPLLAEQCNTQRIQMPRDTSNFRWDALLAVIGAGIPLWLLGTFAEFFAGLILKYVWRRHERRLDWIAHGPLSLHRIGYQAAGYGTWWHTYSDTPVCHIPAAPARQPRFDYGARDGPVLS